MKKREFTVKRISFIFVFALSALITQAVTAQNSDEVKVQAQRAVKSMEAKLASTTRLNQRLYLHYDLQSAAWSAGDAETAGKNARDLLALGEETKRKTDRSVFEDTVPSFAVHYGNTMLGLIAFERGNIASAKEYLLESAQINGEVHPSLSINGPSMELARRLADSGEREAVVRFLDLCAGFWEPKSQRGRTEKWKNLLKQGKTPNFGANDGYATRLWRYRN